jgi:hypothetical protein
MEAKISEQKNTAFPLDNFAVILKVGKKDYFIDRRCKTLRFYNNYNKQYSSNTERY